MEATISLDGIWTFLESLKLGGKERKWLIEKLSNADSKPDPTLMTKEQFFAEVDESLEQARQGKVKRMLPNENLDDFLKRCGYAI